VFAGCEYAGAEDVEELLLAVPPGLLPGAPGCEDTSEGSDDDCVPAPTAPVCCAAGLLLGTLPF